MDDSKGSAQEAALPWRAVLTPHRSLTPRGFLILMSLLSLVSIATGLAFYWAGAWPVAGFLGLDVALVYFAFKLNYRAGRAYETVELLAETLTVTRVHASGRRESVALNPYWVRVRLREFVDGRTALSLTSHGREIPFGRCLTDDERRDFAAALTGALIVARSGPG